MPGLKSTPINPLQGTISQMLGVSTPQPPQSASFSLYDQRTWNQDQFQGRAAPTPAPTQPVQLAVPPPRAVGQVSQGHSQLLAPGQLFNGGAVAVSPRPQSRPTTPFGIVSQLAQTVPTLERVPRPKPRPTDLAVVHSNQLDYGDPNEIIDTGLKDVQGRSIRLTREAARGLFKIMDIAKTRGIDVRVTSSHRTVEHQERLWKKALKKYGSARKARKWVAPPGKSRHNYGKAIDMHMYKGKNKISQNEFDEIIAKAGMYRPMSWEGWHIEPLSTKKSRA